MPRPSSVTSGMIATALIRVGGGEPLVSVAGDMGVSPAALGYHLRGGKAARYIEKPWDKPLREARRHIGTGNRLCAAYKLVEAARFLLRSAS